MLRAVVVEGGLLVLCWSVDWDIAGGGYRAKKRSSLGGKVCANFTYCCVDMVHGRITVP